MARWASTSTATASPPTIPAARSRARTNSRITPCSPRPSAARAVPRSRGHSTAPAYTTYLIQFFSNPTADPSGYGQGKTLIGSITVTTDVNGNASFTATFSSTVVPVGQFIIVTATNPVHNTSEFAMDVTVTAAPAPAAVTPSSQAGGPSAGAAAVASPASQGSARLPLSPSRSPRCPGLLAAPQATDAGTLNRRHRPILEAIAQDVILFQRRRRIGLDGNEAPSYAGGSL